MKLGNPFCCLCGDLITGKVCLDRLNPRLVILIESPVAFTTISDIAIGAPRFVIFGDVFATQTKAECTNLILPQLAIWVFESYSDFFKVLYSPENIGGLILSHATFLLTVPDFAGLDFPKNSYIPTTPKSSSRYR